MRFVSTRWSLGAAGLLSALALAACSTPTPTATASAPPIIAPTQPPMMSDSTTMVRKHSMKKHRRHMKRHMKHRRWHRRHRH